MWDALLKCGVHHLYVGCLAKAWGAPLTWAALTWSVPVHEACVHELHHLHVLNTCMWGTLLTHGVHSCRGALLTHGAHSCMGALLTHEARLCMGALLARGTRRWGVEQAGRWGAPLSPRGMVTARRVAKRQCPALEVQSASEDEKFLPNVLIHSACRYAHGN